MSVNVEYTVIFIRNVLIGQLISFLNSLTGVWSTLLVENDSSYPLLQSLTGYVCIFLVYLPLFIFFLRKYNRERFSNFQFLWRPWKYAILGLVDLEANFLAIKAYQYTDILSIQLLSCLTIPLVFVLSIFLLHSSFGLSHVLGSVLALVGLIFLTVKDYSQNYSITGKSRAIGDLLCVGSSFCYALSNVLTELFVKTQKKSSTEEIAAASLPEEDTSEKKYCEERLSVESFMENIFLEEDREEIHSNTMTPKNEVLSEKETRGPESTEEEVNQEMNVPIYIPVIENLAMMSFFGSIFATIQFFATDWKTFCADESHWSNLDYVYQFVFGINMLALYTLMPILFILCSACFANVSLLTVNIFGFLFNYIILNEPANHYIYVPIILIVVGLIFFNITDLISSKTLYRINQPWKKFN